jgi:hypothetical protein
MQKQNVKRFSFNYRCNKAAVIFTFQRNILMRLQSAHLVGVLQNEHAFTLCVFFLTASASVAARRSRTYRKSFDESEIALQVVVVNRTHVVANNKCLR